jgi:hypothetical protein
MWKTLLEQFFKKFYQLLDIEGGGWYHFSLPLNSGTKKEKPKGR